jgi:hypothetical protein
MSCLKSFTFYSTGIELFPDPQLVWWGTTNVNSWIFNNIGATTSNFAVQGFKNINVYGIDMIGSVYANTFENRGALVEDWGFTLKLDGLVPEISGDTTVSPNFYGITTAYPAIQNVILTKYKTNINFADPIQSVKNITIAGLYAQGSNLQTPGLIRLAWDITYVVYYKYEGEDL